MDRDLLQHHAHFVRRLARRLVRDDAAAADVEQETWLRVLKRPPDTARPLRPWLATIVRNLVRRRHRDAARRRRREEAAAAPEAVPSAASLAARREILVGVVEEVFALAEPYRHTVLAHYYEGLPYAAIAARDGVSIETVRSRLKRARALLRHELDRRFGTRRAWAVGLALLAGIGPRRRWMAAPAAAVLAVGALGWMTVGGLRGERADAVRPAVASYPTRASLLPATDTPHVPAPVQRDWEVVAMNADRRPVAGIAIWTRNEAGNLIWAHTDAHGVARFALATDALDLCVHNPDASLLSLRTTTRRTVVSVGRTLPIDVVLVDGRNGRPLDGGEVSGPGGALARSGDGFVDKTAAALPGHLANIAYRVRPPSGYAVAGATSMRAHASRYAERLRYIVPLLPAGFERRSEPPVPVAEPRVEGEVTHADGWTTVRGVVHFPDESAPFMLYAQPRTSTQVFDLLFVLDRPLTSAHRNDAYRLAFDHAARHAAKPPGPTPGRLVATVRRSDGRPAPFARVRFDDCTEVRADRTGRIVRRVAAGLHRLELREPGLTTARIHVNVPPHGTGQAELVETPGRRLAVRVEDEHGAPVPFAAVAVAPYVHIRDGIQHLTCFTDEHGVVILDGLPPWEVNVRARHATRAVVVRLGD